jgi:hypothetical protein
MSSQSNPELCSNDVLERAALTLVPSAPVPSTRQIALSRRLDAVLDDIGFGSAARKSVGSHVGAGIGFAHLSLESVDELIRKLEDLTSSANCRCHRAGTSKLEVPQQLRLF